MPRKKAIAPQGDKAVEVSRPNKADLFVDAFIRHRFNGTAAALEVFDIEGDDEARRRNVASSIAYTYLRKSDVAQKLRERMERTDVSVEWVIAKLKALGEKTESDDTALRVLDRLAHFVGAEIKERSTDVSAARNAHLNLYMGLPPPQKEGGPVIEARLSK